MTFVFIGILFISFTIITLIFPSITIFIIIFNWKSQCRSITNLFACNSSAALIFYVITISIQIPFIFQSNEKQINLVFCKLCAFIYVCACSVKSLSYLVQVISRWCITVHYKHRNLLRLRINMLIIIISWIISFITSASILFSSNAYQYESVSRLCVLTSKVFLTSFIPVFILFIIPANIIILLYGIIPWHTTRIHRVQPNGITAIVSKRNVQVYQNILILLGIIIIGGTPYVFSIVINRIAENPQPLYSIAVIFISIAAVLESLVIFFTNQQIKTLLYNKICCYQPQKMIVAIT